MTVKHITKRQLQTEANRQYIMNVAQNLFSHNGYEKTSMKEISTAAKLPIGSLYYHFKNKEDLLLQIFFFAVSYVRCVTALLGVRTSSSE